MHTVAVAAPAFVVSIAGLGVPTAIIVQTTKFLIKLLVPDKKPYQAQVVQLYVFVVAGVVVGVVDFLTYNLVTRAEALNAIGDAFSVAIAAIVTYHVLTSDALPAPAQFFTGLAAAPPVTPPTPPSAVPDAPPPTP